MAPITPSKKKWSGAVKRGKRGFVQTGGILGAQIRKATEKRGFSETRLLTQWADIAGPSIAGISRPVKISYGRQGIGASLTLLTTGANAPMLQMLVPQIIERVNACYGYSAISRIHLTQTAPSGFSDPAAPFQSGPAHEQLSVKDREQLASEVSDVTDEGLRQSLARLSEKIRTKPKTNS